MIRTRNGKKVFTYKGSDFILPREPLTWGKLSMKKNGKKAKALV